MENRIKLSREEKLNLLPYIAQMAEITFKIRQSGIFSVKVEIDNSNDDFFILAFNLISGGHNPQHVKNVLDNFIYSSANDSIDYVKKYIIGAEQIQSSPLLDITDKVKITIHRKEWIIIEEGNAETGVAFRTVKTLVDTISPKLLEEILSDAHREYGYVSLYIDSSLPLQNGEGIGSAEYLCPDEISMITKKYEELGVTFSHFLNKKAGVSGNGKKN